MERALLAFIFGCGILSAPIARATEPTLEADAECVAIAETDLSGCRCRGLYFGSKFGPEDGAAALHLVGRSYVPAPQGAVAALYERFGSDRLSRVSRRILETHDEVLSYCPFSAHIAD